MISCFLLTNGVIRTSCDVIEEDLMSWTNVVSFTIKNSSSDDMAMRGYLKTDNQTLATIVFSLYHGHSPRKNLESEITKCLYTGFVTYESLIDKNSPVRLKYCLDKQSTILELSGFFLYYKTMYTLHTLTNNGSWIMYSNADIKNETSKMVNYGARIPTLAKDSGTKIFGNDSNAIDKRFEKTRSSNFGGYKTQERSYVEILIINSYEYFMKYGSSNQTASFNSNFKLRYNSVSLLL